MHWHQLRSQISQVFQVTSHIVGIFALHFVSTIQLLSLYQFIQFLTCTRIPCRDSHCENGLVRCCLFTLCDDQDMCDMAADPCWWSSDVCRTVWTVQVECGIRNRHCAEVNQRESHESEVPRPLFALAGSLRGWHQRDPSQRLGIPNLAGLRRFLPRQADIAAQPRIENLPRLAALSLPLRSLPSSCPNIAPAVLKLVVVALG